MLSREKSIQDSIMIVGVCVCLDPLPLILAVAYTEASSLYASK